MALYMLMLLADGAWNETTVFGPATARAFRTPLQATPSGINGWAHGFMTFDLAGGIKAYGHRGDIIAFYSNMVLVPELDLGIFITTNRNNGESLAEALLDELVRHFIVEPQVFPRPGSPGLAARPGDYEDQFVETRRAYGGLDAGRFISTTGDERLEFRLAGDRATSFRLAANVGRLERARLDVDKHPGDPGWASGRCVHHYLDRACRPQPPQLPSEPDPGPRGLGAEHRGRPLYRRYYPLRHLER